MSSNLPDDWNSYSGFCTACRQHTHASEGHACACDDDDELDEEQLDEESDEE